MAYLKKSDITDKAVQDCIADDNDAYLVRADEELTSLAEALGVSIPEVGTLQGDVAGTVLVKGAANTGKNLTVDGFTTATGTVKAGTRISIQGLAKSYLVSADAAKASSEALLVLTADLENTPADNAPVSFFPLHPDVRKWMVKWLCLTVCLEQIGVNDQDNPTVNDKYYTKWSTYKKEESDARKKVTPEMIDDQVTTREERVPLGLEVYRE